MVGLNTRRDRRRPSRRSAVTAALALVVSLVPALVVSSASPASAADPDSVSVSLQGCRNDGTLTLPNTHGDFVCSDTAYTPGNLGKGWNELDLVPYRLVLDAGSSAPTLQTFTVAYAVDREDAGTAGYDVLSEATPNGALSSPSCAAAVITPAVTMAPGLGGTDKTLFRTLTIAQTKGTKCVFDFYARLALGSHLYPGASLHGNVALVVDPTTVTTQRIGARDVSIPVNEISPQEIYETIGASRNANHIWTASKSPSAANLSFGNSCMTATTGASQTVNVTVSWSKSAANPTGYTVMTSVYANNPAARSISVTVTDVIKSGSQVLSTKVFPAVSVPAGMNDYLVGTHSVDVAASAVGSPASFNSSASGTYQDTATGIAIPGTATTAASLPDSAIATGTTTNSTATVSDVVSITGDGLTFSVAAPSLGAFTGGYVADTPTAAPVSWTLTGVSGSGSVTFAKTVYLDRPRITSGTLADTATITGATSGTHSHSASVGLDSGALVALTVNKTLSPASANALSFGFDVTGPAAYASSFSLSFPAGTTTGTRTLSGLAPGTYSIDEPASFPFVGQSATATINLPTCSATVAFTNSFNPPRAQVKKVTVPAGSESGWAFVLRGTGLPTDGVPVQTTGTGAAPFPVDLQTGSYTITETTQTGWDVTAVSGTPSGRVSRPSGSASCAFSVDQTADADSTFECVFTNTQRGKIVIDKVTQPEGSSQSFPFTLQGGPSALSEAFSLTDTAAARESAWVRPGSGYSAAETTLSGWDQSSAVCSDGSPVTDIDVSAGETVICTFTNTQRGRIVVHKTTDPASTASFPFALAGNGRNDTFSLQNGQEHDTGHVIVPGSGYSVAETVPAGWDLSSAACSDQSPVTAIAVSPGETVHCYFVNTQRGQIVIDKVTDPVGDPQSFAFTLSGGPSALTDAFALTDAAEPRSSGYLPPGSGYNAAETVPAGWDQTSATCNDGSPVTNISVSPGEVVLCTFTNTKRARLLVDKVTLPAGDPQQFSFSSSGPGGHSQSFSLADATAAHASGALVPGSYAVAEAVPSGWDQTDATCSDGSPATAVQLSPGETVTCTFTNTKRARIVVDKVTLPAPSTQSFPFTLTGPSLVNDNFALTAAALPRSSTALLPGAGYAVSESTVDGWDQTAASCDDGSPVTGITLSPGEVVTCTFTNTQRGKILVDKITDPAGSPQSFDFSVTGGPDAVNSTFQLADTSLLHENAGLRPGTYAAAESSTLPAGWSLTSATCSDGSPASAVAVGPGETVTCTFRNQARGSAAVVKTLSGSPIPVGSPHAFTFQLRQGATPVDAGTLLESKVANAANGGAFGFTSALVPGTTYQVCEIVMPGWSTTLGTFVPDSFLPPDGAVPDPLVDNSVLCGNFSVSPGQTMSFAVNNTPPPGGRALTIGFWKNWSSCSGGQQAPVLDRTLTSMEPTGVVLSAAGTPLGFTVVYLALRGSTATPPNPDRAQHCRQAVAILNKSRTDTGKKQASDPAFNMAAQQLAASLNYAAGAGMKGSVTAGLTQAVLLLGKYEFNGSTHLPISKADAATMNTLAKLFDDYNNNLL
jgi:hypothetical protein